MIKCTLTIFILFFCFSSKVQDFWPSHWDSSWKPFLYPGRTKQLFEVRLEKHRNIVGNLKKGTSFILRRYNYSNCIAKVSGKRWNLKDGEEVKVSYNLTGKKSYVEVSKRDYNWITISAYLGVFFVVVVVVFL